MTTVLREQGTSASTELTLEQTQKCEPAWLCLRFNYLSLNALGVRYQGCSNVLVSDEHQVWQLSQQAEDFGLTSGQSIGHALMLNPHVQFLERDREQEVAMLSRLSDWAYRFTSQVSVYDDHTLLLEIGRSVSLFRGLKHLQHLMCVDLERLNMDVCYAVARTPKAAHLLSFCGIQEWCLEHNQALLEQAFLADMSLHSKTLAQLQHCGFITLGDLMPIPNAELGQRFGHDFVEYWQQLLGTVADPQITITPVETFSAHIDFAEPISNRLWIEQQISRLLEDLLGFIQARQLQCRGFVWQFYHADNRLLKTIKVGLNSNNLNLAMLRELTDLKLASNPIEWEFSRIELSSDDLVQRPISANDLFNPLPNQEQFDRLIDRLHSRLGHQALQVLSTDSEHLPELASRQKAISMEREGQQTYNQPKKSSQATQSLADEIEHDQPLWLFEHPQRLQQHAQQPYLDGPLTIIHGPDRLASHWWVGLQSRDYYIVRQVSGRLLWVYYERTQQHWYLHGTYA